MGLPAAPGAARPPPGHRHRSENRPTPFETGNSPESPAGAAARAGATRRRGARRCRPTRRSDVFRGQQHRAIRRPGSRRWLSRRLPRGAGRRPAPQHYQRHEQRVHARDNRHASDPGVAEYLRHGERRQADPSDDLRQHPRHRRQANQQWNRQQTPTGHDHHPSRPAPVTKGRSSSTLTSTVSPDCLRRASADSATVAGSAVLTMTAPSTASLLRVRRSGSGLQPRPRSRCFVGPGAGLNPYASIAGRRGYERVHR